MEVSNPSPTILHPSVTPSAADVPRSNTYTYHCVCTQLLLASTTPLAALPVRADPALDHAHILPLPPLPTNDTEDEEMGGIQSNDSTSSTEANPHHAIMLSTTQDRRPLVVRREDGFEKRWLTRCGRCRLVVGYMLDDIHRAGTAAMEEDSRVKYAYLLPGGLLSTEEMGAGKKIEEKDLILGT